MSSKQFAAPLAHFVLAFVNFPFILPYPAVVVAVVDAFGLVFVVVVVVVVVAVDFGVVDVTGSPGAKCLF